jgi:hypothetical protein
MNRDKFKTNYEHDDWKQGVDAFLRHVSMGDVKPDQDDPDFAEGFEVDPIYQVIRQSSEFNRIKNELAHKRFRNILMDLHPKND